MTYPIGQGSFPVIKRLLDEKATFEIILCDPDDRMVFRHSEGHWTISHGRYPSIGMEISGDLKIVEAVWRCKGTIRFVLGHDSGDSWDYCGSFCIQSWRVLEILSPTD